MGLSPKSNTTPSCAPLLGLGNSTLHSFLADLTVGPTIDMNAGRNRFEVETLLRDMVESLIDEFIQPQLNHLVPRPE